MQQLTIGTLLRGGSYKIEKVLGQGSFGITYLAEHSNLGRKVAIKEFFMKELNSRGEDGSITGMTDGSLSQNYCVKFQKEAVMVLREELRKYIKDGSTVADFIRSRPAASAPFLISAASECLRRKYPLNSCELHSVARELRYAN